MTDDLVNADDLAERKKQRESLATATDDGMPVGPECKAADVAVIQYTTPKKWAKSTRKWPGIAGAAMQSGRPLSTKHKADLP
jgi:hypothetical protein